MNVLVVHKQYIQESFDCIRNVKSLWLVTVPKNVANFGLIYKWLFGLTVCYHHVMYDFQSKSTLYSLPECQGTPCSKQTPYLKFKWQQRDSNPQPLSS